MAKKRKNTQEKKPASGASGSGKQKSASGNGQSDAATKKGFEFPLHLVSSGGFNGQYDYAELQELCKGRCWVIPSFFSSKECKAWIDFCEGGNGFEYTTQRASKYYASRECYRLQQENANELSERIFERMKGMKGGSLLEQIREETADIYPSGRGGKQGVEYKPINCNPNIRVYRYDKGHSFGRHVDGSDITQKGTTEMTMLVYLSTCQGGATRFYQPHKRSKDSDASFAFEPQVGTLLLHVHGKHCLDHEAEIVTGGQKYVLRTDLVYGNE